MVVNGDVAENLHIFLISLALLLTPFSGISGLPLLGSMGKTASVYPLLCGVVLWLVQTKGKIKIPRYYNYRLLLFFYFVAIGSIIINIDDIQYYHFQGQTGLQRSVVQIMSLGLCVLVPAYIYDTMNTYKGNVYELFFKWIEYSFFVAGVYSVFELLSFFNIGDASSYLAFIDSMFRYEETEGYISRIRSVTSEPSSFGEYCAVLLPWMIYKSGYKKRYFFLTIYLLVLCFLSVSRTMYVVLILQFFLCAIMYGAKYKKIIGIFIVTISFIGSIFYAQLSDSLGERTFDVVVMSVIDSEGTVFDLSNVARYGSQEAALNMFKESPIFGVGYGMYGFLAPDYYPQYSWISKEILVRSLNTTQDGAWPPVHSLIARVMGEMGIIGAFAWVLMIISTIYYIYICSSNRRNGNDIYAKTVIISLLGCFVMEFKTDSIYTFPLYIIVGMSMIAMKRKEMGDSYGSDA